MEPTCEYGTILPVVQRRANRIGIYCIQEGEAMDWRVEINEFLKEPWRKNDRRIKLRSLNYTLIEGELLKKRSDGILLKCVSLQEAKVIMAETHE